MNRLHRQLIGIFLVQNVVFNNNDFSMPFLLWNISHRLNQHNWKCLISFIRNCFYVLGYFFAALLHSVSIFIFFSVEFFASLKISVEMPHLICWDVISMCSLRWALVWLKFRNTTKASQPKEDEEVKQKGPAVYKKIQKKAHEAREREKSWQQ